MFKYFPPRPRPAAPSLLAFLDPFTTDVYVYTLGVFVFTSFSMYVLGRFSPNQWEEGAEPEDEYTNCFTMLGCFWFTFGHFLGQGSDLTCIAINIRFKAANGPSQSFAVLGVSCLPI